MHAIVLARRNYREYDQIITLYTKEEGILRVVAKGVKKIKSKNTSALEPFALVHVGIAPGKEYAYVTSVSIEQYFSSIRNNILACLHTIFICDLLVSTLHAGEPDATIYTLLLESLQQWNATTGVTVQQLDIFMLHFVSALGFTPYFSTKKQSCVYSFSAGNCIPSSQVQENGPCISLSDILVDAIIQGDNSALSEKEKGVFHSFVLQFCRFSLEKGIPDWANISKQFDFSSERETTAMT